MNLLAQAERKTFGAFGVDWRKLRWMFDGCSLVKAPAWSNMLMLFIHLTQRQLALTDESLATLPPNQPVAPASEHAHFTNEALTTNASSPRANPRVYKLRASPQLVVIADDGRHYAVQLPASVSDEKVVKTKVARRETAVPFRDNDHVGRKFHGTSAKCAPREKNEGVRQGKPGQQRAGQGL